MKIDEIVLWSELWSQGTLEPTLSLSGLSADSPRASAAANEANRPHPEHGSKIQDWDTSCTQEGTPGWLHKAKKQRGQLCPSVVSLQTLRGSLQLPVRLTVLTPLK